MRRQLRITFAILVFSVAIVSGLLAQPDQPKKDFQKDLDKKGGFFFGPPGGQERKIVNQFDKNSDGWLNAQERKEAREFLKKEGNEKGFGGPKGFGGGKGFGGPKGLGRGNQEPAKPGPKVTSEEVKSYPNAKLYDSSVLRTIFLEFENKDWEAELTEFHNTDVEVPATMTVDGKKYANVGVHFRGMSSYMGVPQGYKRSLNVAIDLADSKQRLYGYKTLNLLNSHEDGSFMSSVLYSHIARQYIPAPKANFVKVVINGESWGIYASVQQFNKEFLSENFKTTKGARWKVRGSPGGGGGLDYIGDRIEDYKRRYQIKSNDEETSWKALIHLCKTIHQTPVDQLEKALEPILDIDGLLWFLALDISLINCDGYWIRASDYSLFQDDKGKFHIIPHDMNEAFRPGMGPGFGGMGGRGGPGGPMMGFPPSGEVIPVFLRDMLQLTDEQKKKVDAIQKEVDEKIEKLLTEDQKKQFKELRPKGPPLGGLGGGPGGPGGGNRNPLEVDPLTGLDDPRKPLRSKLLQVPAFKKKYLQHVKTIAEESLDWKKLGPVVNQYRKLIEKEIEIDTRKLTSFESFKELTAEAPENATPSGPRRMEGMNLKVFADQRRKYLLNHAEVKKAAE
jgi:spore coat protein CotH